MERLSSKLLIFIFLFSISKSSFGQQLSDFYFTERLSDSLPQKPDSIVVIASGNTLASIFLSEFNTHLSKLLVENGIKSEYNFIIPDKENKREYIDSLKAITQRPILLLVANGSDLLNISTRKKNNSFTTPKGENINFITSKRKIDYQQNFSFILVANYKDIYTEYWHAYVEVFFDLSKPKKSKKLAEKVIAAFKKRGYM
jgi:hypothetical protein